MRTTNLPATTAQKQVIHRLRRQRNLDEDTYRSMIRSFSGGRTDTSAQLTKTEATELIGRLIDPDGKNRAMEDRKYRLVCRIYRASCQISGLNAPFDSRDPDEKRMNIAKLNTWIMQYGSCKKPVSQQNYEELKQTYRQLEARRRKEAGDE